MGALNTLLDIANFGAEIALASKVEQIRRRGTTAALMQAILIELRNQIFKYSEAAKSILKFEAQSPKLATGALWLLQGRLIASEITPDLFLELSDKEYTSTTISLIRENAARLLSQLPPYERAEVENLVAKAPRLSDYNYYLNNYEKLQLYRQTLPASTGLGTGILILGRLGILGGGCLGFVSLCMFLVFIPAGANPGNGMLEPLLFLFFGAVAGGTILISGISAVSRSKKGISAKTIVDKIRKEVDISKMEKLDAEFGTDTQKVKELRDDARMILNQFFAGNIELSGYPDTEMNAVMLDIAGVTTAHAKNISSAMPSGESTVKPDNIILANALPDKIVPTTKPLSEYATKLLTALRSKHAHTRRSAAEQLGQLGEKHDDVISTLKTVVEVDEDIKAREVAKESLRLLTGK